MPRSSAGRDRAVPLLPESSPDEKTLLPCDSRRAAFGRFSADPIDRCWPAGANHVRVAKWRFRPDIETLSCLQALLLFHSNYYFSSGMSLFKISNGFSSLTQFVIPVYDRC